nr:MAG TPA: hypothetical protein [Caudoviricetes sp.]
MEQRQRTGTCIQARPIGVMEFCVLAACQSHPYCLLALPPTAHPRFWQPGKTQQMDHFLALLFAQKQAAIRQTSMMAGSIPVLVITQPQMVSALR